MALSRWLLGVALVAILGDATAQTSASKPNIILCMADDQGYGDVGYTGDTPLKTPTLDAMANAGLRFDRFYSASSVCSPTRGSVMTGRNPNRFGCFSWGYTLRPEEVTVAEALKTAGYATGHFGKWHLGSVRAGNPLNPGASGFDEWQSSPNFYENDPLMSHRGKVVQWKGESSMATVEAALPFMRDAVKREQPFLAVIWFGNPHLPHQPTEQLAKLYEGQPAALQKYWAEITGLDLAVGRLRKELDLMGVRGDTLLWYTSDNGATTPGSTGGFRGRKGTLWEGGIRVPAIVEWPARIKQPRATDVPCGSFDIYPTLVELTGARPKTQPPLDGVSLVPLLDGTMKERPKPMGFWDYTIAGQRTPSGDWLKKMKGQEADGQPAPATDPDEFGPWTTKVPEAERKGHAAWIDGRFKLHRFTPPKGDVRYELYDLAADPKETTDLAASQGERVTAMKAALEAWQASVVRSLNGGDYEQ